MIAFVLKQGWQSCQRYRLCWFSCTEHQQAYHKSVFYIIFIRYVYNNSTLGWLGPPDCEQLSCEAYLHNMEKATHRPQPHMQDDIQRQPDLLPTKHPRHNVAGAVPAVQLDACKGPGAGQQLGGQAHVGWQAAEIFRHNCTAPHLQLVHCAHLKQLSPVHLHLLHKLKPQCLMSDIWLPPRTVNYNELKCLRLC